MNVESRLKELNLELPAPPKPAGVYKPVVIAGSLAFTSGHLPAKADGSGLITGRVGAELSVADGKEAAQRTGLAILSSLKQTLGDLNRVKRLVKVVGMVHCTPEFHEHPAVINGCSELFRDVFGEERGIGARSAVGMSSLPLNVAVEIEAIFEIE